MRTITSKDLKLQMGAVAGMYVVQSLTSVLILAAISSIFVRSLMNQAPWLWAPTRKCHLDPCQLMGDVWLNALPKPAAHLPTALTVDPLGSAQPLKTLPQARPYRRTKLGCKSAPQFCFPTFLVKPTLSREEKRLCSGCFPAPRTHNRQRQLCEIIVERIMILISPQSTRTWRLRTMIRPFAQKSTSKKLEPIRFVGGSKYLKELQRTACFATSEDGMFCGIRQHFRDCQQHYGKQQSNYFIKVFLEMVVKITFHFQSRWS